MDLPPSAKLVFLVIDREGSVTQQHIAEETLLPKRTVRYALGRLAEIDAITEETNLADARQPLYSTPTPSSLTERSSMTLDAVVATLPCTNHPCYSGISPILSELG